MAKVLEALIAKGRRVRRPREQKEVAFGLCDLSTHEELHERIVKKGGIKSLVNLLAGSQDNEAQRFSALAIGNCASAAGARTPAGAFEMRRSSGRGRRRGGATRIFRWGDRPRGAVETKSGAGAGPKQKGAHFEKCRRPDRARTGPRRSTG